MHAYIHSTFLKNTSPNGIVAILYVALEFTGTNNFSNNVGPAMRVSLTNPNIVTCSHACMHRL